MIGKCFVLSILLSAASAVAQSQDTLEKEWSVDFAFQEYFLPEEDDLSIPVLSLYLKDFLYEARYQYESRRAGSFWLGRPFTFGESWEFELTPMIGGIIGSVHGAAPGFKADITWESINIYSEMEYVFDFDDRESNFFYSWSEITVGILDWLRIGIVGNRTRAYDSSVEIDRGPIVSLEFDYVSLSCTALNLDEQPIFVAGFEVSI